MPGAGGRGGGGGEGVGLASVHSFACLAGWYICALLGEHPANGFPPLSAFTNSSQRRKLARSLAALVAGEGRGGGIYREGSGRHLMRWDELPDKGETILMSIHNPNAEYRLG